MPERLEEIMKKIHIYLANCQESAYSSEEVIVSKKRIFDLLNDLNEAVFEICEQYEATREAKEIALMNTEHEAAKIKEDAQKKSEDIYAASLLFTEDSLLHIKSTVEQSYMKVRREYEELLKEYQDQMKMLTDNGEELKFQLENMSEGKTYLRIIEQLRENAVVSEKKKHSTDDDDDIAPKKAPKIVGSVEAVEVLDVPEDAVPTDPAESSYVIQVNATPKKPEVRTKAQKKLNKFFKKTKKDATTGDKSEELQINEDAISEDY